MNKLEKMGRIRLRLLQKKWINSSKSTSILLNSIIKREGISEIEDAVDYVVSTNYNRENTDDVSSRIFILYLTNVIKERHRPVNTSKEVKSILNDILTEMGKDE